MSEKNKPVQVTLLINPYLGVLISASETLCVPQRFERKRPRKGLQGSTIKSECGFSSKGNALESDT